MRDLGSAYDPAALVPDRGDGDRHLNSTTILVEADRFIRFDTLTRRDLRENAVFLFLAVRGDEDAYRLPDDLLCAITEKQFSSRVEARYHPIAGFAYDGIGRRGDNGSEPVCGILRLQNPSVSPQ